MTRQQQMEHWVASILPNINDAPETTHFTVQAASEDASFRSYHRITQGEMTWILMDAPPSHEDCGSFIMVQKQLYELGVNVPSIVAKDLKLGFLLLADLGNTLLLDELNENNVDALYGLACQQIHMMQSSQELPLPVYNEALLNTEMQLFSDWFIDRHLGETLSESELDLLEQTQALLRDNALNQPQGFVHRDFHSRNLMIQKDKQLAVIDFQDAVWGPVTYDLVSLFKDCYIAWPEAHVYHWVDQFRQQYNNKHNSQHDQTTFLRWFDLMGVQRHMKAIGIFCRLNYRDGKKHYLHDIPRTMKHLQSTCLAYPELKAFSQLLDRIQPKLHLA